MEILDSSKVGLPVNVAVDSFPSGEFGYITGTLSKLGSDVFHLDRESQQYRFPATVSLEQIVQSGDQQLNLQSGMGILANIKLRSRPVITIVSDLFTKQLDGVKIPLMVLAFEVYSVVICVC